MRRLKEYKIEGQQRLRKRSLTGQHQGQESVGVRDLVVRLAGDHSERWEVHVVGTSTEWGHILVYRDDNYARIK